MGRKDVPSDADAVVARIAARQYGVVSLEQLGRAGLREGSVRRRVERGRLHRVHRGVYAIGHSGLSIEGLWMAAVLALGPGAAISHVSAAQLWRLLPQPRAGWTSEHSPVVHVTAPTRAGRGRRSGLRIHRPKLLDQADVTRRDNIPVTTPSRTLIDLRRTVPRPQFAAALREAEFIGLPVDDLEPDHTRSELEARFLALCRRHRVPRPEVNVRLGPFTVDFLWPTSHLIVELDGYQGHAGRVAFEADRARDVELKALGYEVLRLTWRQVAGGSAGTAALLRKVLAAHRK
jgi:very-short-patch-repair endonuclease